MLSTDATDHRPLRTATGVQVISRAAKILRTLRYEHRGLSLGQIAERVGLPRSTVQRIVRTLITERILTRTSTTGLVRLGEEIGQLARHLKIAEQAHPLLASLSKMASAKATLAVLCESHLQVIGQYPPTRRPGSQFAANIKMPIHSTAGGKASLSLLTDDIVKRRLAATKLTTARGGPRTIDSVLRELGDIRKAGLAYEYEEFSLGTSAAGAAFRDQQGTIYAISISMPCESKADLAGRASEFLLPARADVIRLLAP